MASLSDVRKCVTEILPEYVVDVQEDFDNAAVSLTIKKGTSIHQLKVADNYIESINPDKISSDLAQMNFVTRMINAGSHPLYLDEDGLKYLD